jgi:tetratricopeptide (TPR) repeat protein
MATQQTPGSSGDEKPQGGHGSELTRLSGILLGLALIIGAANDEAVKLSNQVVPELPPPGVLAVRVLVGLVGALLLLWGLIGLLGPSVVRGMRWLSSLWRGRRRPRPPAPEVGLPPDRNPLFRGRKGELDLLQRRLTADRRVDLSGLGGVGKSQLAIEHLHRHRDDHPDGVFWLRAETPAGLSADFAALAWLPLLRLPEREEPEQERVIEAVTAWLRAHPRWLMVVDNLDQAALPTLDRLLARGLDGQVLVTSRVPVWDPAPLAVGPLPPEEATALLLERSGQADEAAAAAVAEILDGLPLALVQAAGYVRTSGRALGEYAELLRTRLGDVLREGRPADYPLTAAATWRLSFERIEREQPAAAGLLRLCAFLAPDDIPVGVLRAGAGELPRELRRAAGDEVRLDRAIAELRRYALVERRDDRLSVHRLVQAVVRDSLAGEQGRRWLAAAARLLEHAFPDEVRDPKVWPVCARLLPHAQLAVDQAGEQVVEPRATSWLLDRIATYLHYRGEFSSARPLYERALAICEKVLGPDHPDTATSLNNLAGLLLDQGELAAARPLFERALAIHERVLGPDHPNTAANLNNLAGLLRDQGELAAARPLFERALEVRERVLGPDHPDIASSLNNLALLLEDQGELAAARPLSERALEVRERVLPDHPDTATSLDNLAWLLKAQGELAATRPLFERALEVRERVLGPDHPDTATSLNNLALLLEVQGELAAARPLFERALAVCEKVLGPDHPDTATSLDNLAGLLLDQGELAAARPLFERALEVRERVLGPDHPDTTAVRLNLANLSL